MAEGRGETSLDCPRLVREALATQPSHLRANPQKNPWRKRRDSDLPHVQLGKLRLGEVEGLYQTTQQHWVMLAYAPWCVEGTSLPMGQASHLAFQTPCLASPSASKDVGRSKGTVHHPTTVAEREQGPGSVLHSTLTIILIAVSLGIQNIGAGRGPAAAVQPPSMLQPGTPRPETGSRPPRMFCGGAKPRMREVLINRLDSA